MRLDLSRRTDGELLREFSALVDNDRRSTSDLLAYVGEIDARKLFVPAGYPSMYWYCVRALHMSEDMAWKRTRVARLARRFPVILEMVADGRLHVSGLVLLAPHRIAGKFPELLEAAVHKTRDEIELLLAERFPKPDAPTEVRPVAASAPCQGMAPGPVVETHVALDPSSSDSTDAGLGHPTLSTESTGDSSGELRHAASWVERPAEPAASAANLKDQVALRARVRPLAPERYAIQVTVGQVTHDKLRRAPELLGHQVPVGDLEQVLDRALDALIRQLEHAKFAATEKPRRARQGSTVGKRHIPAAVQRAVHERDGGQCTFVSDSGHRCDERRDLQFDHIEPFARGGEATVKGIRLLCPAHNQYEAERTYGVRYMERKRGAAG